MLKSHSDKKSEDCEETLEDLTIAIPVRNEEKNLDVCLKAIGTDFAKNIIVIDSGSSDGTVQVARENNVEVVNFNWNGYFPKKRNWFLRTYKPNTKWILFLDADEILNRSVKQEIRSKLKNSKHQGFLLSYTNYFLGQRLRGGYPLRKLALFRVGEIEYERIDQDNWSKCDMEVHEHPVVNGSVGVIKSRIDHRDLRGLNSYICKHNDYAEWEAKRIIHHRANQNAPNHWNNTQRFKYRIISSPWGGITFFLGSYFAMGGWRDGAIGFAFCLLKASYFTQIACRVREIDMINENKLT